MDEYRSRINRVLDYIDLHLEDPLTLEELAGVACFSPFHFHRIFHSVTGERLFQYIQRIRLEKAAFLLRSHTRRSVTDIALSCGFTNPAAFSRAFRRTFSLSPSRWRQEKSSADSNIGTAQSNPGQATSPWKSYTEFRKGEQIWTMTQGNVRRIVTVSAVPDLELIYMRYTGPYKGDGALFQRLWSRLYTWSEQKGIIGKESRFLALYHDDPDLTDEQLLRVTLAVSTETDQQSEGVFGRMTLQGGLMAQARFRLNSREYQEAWDWVYRQWLPQSGYLPDDRPAYELFPGDEEKSGDARYPVVICVPVQTVS